jgi:hypothetical protein
MTGRYRDRYNDPHRGSISNPVKVTLSCGCVMKVKNRPLRPSTTYPCPSNAGHGYSVSWASWEENGKRGDNGG